MGKEKGWGFVYEHVEAKYRLWAKGKRSNDESDDVGTIYLYDLEMLMKDKQFEKKMIRLSEWKDLHFDDADTLKLPSLYMEENMRKRGKDAFCRKRFPLPMAEMVGDFKITLENSLRTMNH